MKNVLWVAAFAVLVCGIAAQAADTLTLSIQDSDGGTATTLLDGEGPLTLQIKGTLSGGTSQGLALVGVNLGGDVVAPGTWYAPAGDMQQFVKTAGLTNPAGFGGTPSGLDLLQIGGAQNTIGQDGSPPLFPIGTVVTGVALSEQVLAQGTLDADSLAPGTYLFTISGGFANTLDGGSRGTVYAVTPAAIAYGTATYTLVRGTSTPPEIVGDWLSWKNHGTVAVPNWQAIPFRQAVKAGGYGPDGTFHNMETRINSIGNLTCTFNVPIQLPATSDVIVCGNANGPYYATETSLDGTGTVLTMKFSNIPNGQVHPNVDVYTIKVMNVVSQDGAPMDPAADNDIEAWTQYGNVKLSPISSNRPYVNNFDLTDLGINYTAGPVGPNNCMYDIVFTSGSKNKVDNFDYTGMGTYFTTNSYNAPPATCP